MGAPQQFPYPHRCPQPLGALRIELAPTSERAVLGGVWRPYGRDLTREGPHLIDDFPKGRGKIDRLAYVKGDWDVEPTEVFTRYGRIKVGFLPPEQSGVVLLRLAGAGVVRLRIDWEPAVNVWSEVGGRRFSTS